MSEIFVGLRFSRAQAKVIRNVAEGMRGRGLTQPLGLFEKAAEAAESGEPLQVRAESMEEAQRLASTFPTFGIARPAVEPLSGVATL